MKKNKFSIILKIVFSVSPLLFLIFLSFNFSSTGSYKHSQYFPAPNNSNTFLIGAMNSYIDDLQNQTTYDASGLNVTHTYINTELPGVILGDPKRHTPSGRLIADDYLNSDVHQAELSAVIAGLYNNHNYSRFFFALIFNP